MWGAWKAILSVTFTNVRLLRVTAAELVHKAATTDQLLFHSTTPTLRER